MDNKTKVIRKHLIMGNLVIFPTETVYGLGCDATNTVAIKKIYKIKKRPLSNPLICHFSSISKIKENFELSELDNTIANKFWPGPLTLILRKKNKSKIKKILSNKLNFVGCRIPDNRIALKLLKSIPFPLAAPSANLATKISTTRYEDLNKDIKNNALIIKGKKTKFGLESTVIKTYKNKIEILRLGSITQEEIYKYFPKNKIKIIKNNLTSPGSQKKHYSPNLPIRINVKKVKKNEVLLNFGKNNLTSNICEYNLSLNSNLKEAANNFFHFLNLLDKVNSYGIAVAPIPNTGLGRTINDRLTRASYKNV